MTRRFGDNGIYTDDEGTTWYSADGQWMSHKGLMDGKWLRTSEVVRYARAVQANDPTMVGGPASAADPTRPTTNAAATGTARSIGGYTFMGSRELGEMQWVLASCAWTVYGAGFAWLTWAAVTSPVTNPAPFPGILPAILAGLCALYAFRLWTRKAKWVFVIIPLIF